MPGNNPINKSDTAPTASGDPSLVLPLLQICRTASRAVTRPMTAGTLTSLSSSPISGTSPAAAGPAVDSRERTVTANSDDATSKDGRDRCRSEHDGSPSTGSRSASPTVEDGTQRYGDGDEIPQLQLGQPPSTPTPFRRRTRDFKLIPIPKKQQHDPREDFHFTLKLNIVFGFASTASTYVHTITLSRV